MKIYNIQTKGVQLESIVKPACKGRGLYLLDNFITLQAFNVLKDIVSDYAGHI